MQRTLIIFAFVAGALTAGVPVTVRYVVEMPPLEIIPTVAAAAKYVEPTPPPAPEPVLSTEKKVIDNPKPELPKTSRKAPEGLPDMPARLMRIGGCESHGDPNKLPVQFNADGSVLRGVVNRKDVGAFQINEKYHLAASKRLGYDIYTERGNYLYALHLYDKEGSTPWNASRSCWG